MSKLTRTEWLAERRNHIGASEVADILGQGRRTALAVYESKVLGENQADNDWMAFGRDVEGAIANLYAARTKRDIEDLGATSIVYHPDFPIIGATLDRLVLNRDDVIEPGPLELKHVGTFERRDEWEASPPLMYQIQLQTQIACSEASWGSLAGMFPGYQLAYKDFDRDDAFLKVAMPMLEEFWQRVKEKDPPPPQGEKDLPVVKRLWENETGETITLAGNTFERVDLWQDLKKQKLDTEKQIKSIEAELRSIMQTATFGMLPDGRKLTLKETHRKEYTKTVKAGTYRTLRVVKAK